jgi:hypothetical protein
VESFRSLKQAELLAPDDPWVKLYWAEYHAGQNPAEQQRYLLAALESGLPAGPEARAAIDTLMTGVMASQQRTKSDAPVCPPGGLGAGQTPAPAATTLAR